MKMNKTIIKASGSINEIIESLKALKLLYGKGSTLATVQQITRENQEKTKKRIAAK